MVEDGAEIAMATNDVLVAVKAVKILVEVDEAKMIVAESEVLEVAGQVRWKLRW